MIKITVWVVRLFKRLFADNRMNLTLYFGEFMSTSTLPTTALETSVYFSAAAADKVAHLIDEEKNPNLNLRVTVNGGGCSGLQYSFAFDEVIAEEDTIIEQQGAYGQRVVKLVIDYISYQYLKNAEIDYVKNIQGEQFVIRNPNAITTCGCGSSFSVGDE
jgi:iron-sulfur cluster insertion protein